MGSIQGAMLSGMCFAHCLTGADAVSCIFVWGVKEWISRGACFAESLAR